MKNIRIKKTGVETAVSDAYYEQYESQGWFIEINAPDAFPEPEMLIIPSPSKPKAKVTTKE